MRGRGDPPSLFPQLWLIVEAQVNRFREKAALRSRPHSEEAGAAGNPSLRASPCFFLDLPAVLPVDYEENFFGFARARIRA